MRTSVMGPEPSIGAGHERWWRVSFQASAEPARPKDLSILSGAASVASAGAFSSRQRQFSLMSPSNLTHSCTRRLVHHRAERPIWVDRTAEEASHHRACGSHPYLKLVNMLAPHKRAARLRSEPRAGCWSSCGSVEGADGPLESMRRSRSLACRDDRVSLVLCTLDGDSFTHGPYAKRWPDYADSGLAGMCPSRNVP
jgi:hypothetical protein